MAKISRNTWILLAVGVYYAFFPHSIHMQFSPDWVLGFGFEHTTHNIIGIISLILAWLNHQGKLKGMMKRVM